MKALMLAAGLGRRLYGDENQELPKALLQFGGQTLIERHIIILQACGVDELNLIVGHRKDDLLSEVKRVAPDGFVRSFYNPRYREGPKHSLARGEEVLRSGMMFYLWMQMFCITPNYFNNWLTLITKHASLSTKSLSRRMILSKFASMMVKLLILVNP